MIIIEGPDGSGKTMLVERIMSDFPVLTLGRRTAPTRDRLEDTVVQDTYRAFSQAIDGREEIYDRLHFSEWVYGPILRGDCKFTLKQMQYFSMMMPPLALPVICLPPLGQLITNVNTGEHKEGISEHIYDIHGAYHGLTNVNTNPHHQARLLGWGNVIFWNYTHDDYTHSLYPSVEEWLFLRKAASA